MEMLFFSLLKQHIDKREAGFCIFQGTCYFYSRTQLYIWGICISQCCHNKKCGCLSNETFEQTLFYRNPISTQSF